MLTLPGWKKSLIQSAAYTIEQEAKAISGLKNFLDASFEIAITTIHKAGGRIVGNRHWKKVPSLPKKLLPRLIQPAARLVHARSRRHSMEIWE
jgi:hypothetical protein